MKLVPCLVHVSLLFQICEVALTTSRAGRKGLKDYFSNGLNYMAMDDWNTLDNSHLSRRVPNSCGGKKVDLFFAIDTSSDVTEDVTRKQLELISTVSNILTFEEDRTRVGVISYGSDASTAIRLGAYKTRTDFQNGLLLSPGMGGTRDVGQLLKFVEEKGFRSPLSRPSVAHVIIILTNGRTKRLRMALRKAETSKRAGRYIYILHTGSDAIDDEYYRIASFPASSFVFDGDANGLQSSLSSVLAMLPCDLAIDQPVYLPKTSVCQIKRPVDVVFAVDHLSAGKANAKLVYQFIRLFLSEIWDKENKVRVGMVAPRIHSHEFSFREMMVPGRLTSELADVRFPSYSDLLKKTRKLLQRGRPTVSKLAIMFVDESVLVDKAVLAEAEKNKQKKIESYVVSFGEYVDELSLGMMASGRENGYLVRLSSYSQLTRLQKEVSSMICRGL